MRKKQVSIALLLLISSFSFSNLIKLNFSKDYNLNNTNLFQQKKEYQNNWSINVVFSIMGSVRSMFNSLASFAGIFFSGAKYDREFEVIDYFGNT